MTILGNIMSYCHILLRVQSMSNNAEAMNNKVSLFYYDNKVFIIYLHKSIQYWSFSSSHLSGHLAEKDCSSSSRNNSCHGLGVWLSVLSVAAP